MKILLIGGCGYIGSAVFQTLCDEHKVMILDIQRRGYPFKDVVTHFTQHYAYADLTPEVIRKYDMVVMLSGCSSVPESNAYPLRCWQENVTDFLTLITQLPDDLPLIYASSAGVYNGVIGKCIEDTLLPAPTNMYDFSKSTADRLVQQIAPHKRIIGLRFSTVNGPSPNLRPELMLNRMVRTAMHNKTIRVSNATCVRPLLGINDACRFITGLVNKPELIKQASVVNLASFSMTIGQIASKCAIIMNVPVIVEEDIPTYSFDVNTERAKTCYEFQPQDTIDAIVNGLINHESNA